jgi:uncharacterized protein
MNCPNCNETLVMSERNGVEIDYCPKCRGIWLDKGELDKIIEKAGEHYSKRENYERDHKNYHYGDEDYSRKHPHKKKKSFLGDFFDFD